MEPLSEVGPWAKRKLEALRKYLHAYTTIMRKLPWCEDYIYVDAFAGPGEHAIRQPKKETIPANMTPLFLPDRKGDRERQEIIDGSPRIALSLEHPFTTYVFIELDSDRAAQLRTLSEDFPDRKIVVREEECNEYLGKRIIQRSTKFWKTRRALIFLDPFGMQVPWDTIRGLASKKSIEVIINFPVGTIQRLLRRDGEFTEAQRHKLDSYLGSQKWYDIVYKRDRGLFKEVVRKRPRSGELLVRWYCEHQLGSCVDYVSRPSLVKNTKGVHLYYLIHAGHNETGHKIANHILSSGDLIRSAR